MGKNKRSFFERLTGSIPVEGNEEEYEYEIENAEEENNIIEEEPEERPSESKKSILDEAEKEGGALSVDMYQTPDEIIIKSVIGGVRPEDLDVSITRDMVSIKGKREETRRISEDNYFYKELYWGSFSRNILLPQEVEVEEAEAVEKHGMLFLKLPKVNKEKQTKLKVRSN